MADELIDQFELSKTVEFTEIQEVFKTFEHDYEIVNHPHTPINTPFNTPNGLDKDGQRRYNLTLLPKEMTEKQFLAQIQDKRGVIVFYGCMDKDAAMPVYEELQKQYPEKKLSILPLQEEWYKKKAKENKLSRRFLAILLNIKNK